MEDPQTMATPTWEVVQKTDGQHVTERLDILGGWLYRTTVFAGATTPAAGQVAVALVFVPDLTT